MEATAKLALLTRLSLLLAALNSDMWQGLGQLWLAYNRACVTSHSHLRFREKRINCSLDLEDLALDINQPFSSENTKAA